MKVSKPNVNILSGDHSSTPPPPVLDLTLIYYFCIDSRTLVIINQGQLWWWCQTTPLPHQSLISHDLPPLFPLSRPFLPLVPLRSLFSLSPHLSCPSLPISPLPLVPLAPSLLSLSLSPPSCPLLSFSPLHRGSLEGKREQKSYKALLQDPMLRFSGLYQESCSDLYVTCQVFAEGKPLALPVRTSYKAFSTRWK